MKTKISKPQDEGSYVWRGGRKIELEKDASRFTVIPSRSGDLEKMRSLGGIVNIRPVTNQVFKVETTAAKRDTAMKNLRSQPNTVVHHAYHPKGAAHTVYYITDKIIVRFDSNLAPGKIDDLLEKYSLKVLKEYDAQPNALLVQVTSSSGENPIKIANRLAREAGVLSAEPNMVNRFLTAFIPSDGLFKRQWHLNSKKGAQLAAEACVCAPAAWDITRGERKIVVAVVDDGASLDHPDFKGAGKVVFPKDYVDGDSEPFPETAHQDYHGTACAGVAIAECNGTGVVGVAPGCAFMPVRFPLAADDDLLVDIFEEVGAKADVISCSWGPPPVYAPIPTIMSDTLKRLATTGGPRGKGCVICFAAANFDAPVNDPENRNGFQWLDYGTGMIRKTKGPILNGLAAHPNVIAVAASTSLNKHAAYSNWGAEISVCAPSNNFHPLDPRKFVPGRGIWTTDNEAYGEGFTAHSRYTGVFGGTSSATPLVAGVAALVLSANPGLTAAEVKDILQSTADKISDSDPDIVLGINRGQYDARGRCDWFGYGKVNAAKAVAEAKRRMTN